MGVATAGLAEGGTAPTASGCGGPSPTPCGTPTRSVAVGEGLARLGSVNGPAEGWAGGAAAAACAATADSPFGGWACTGVL
ncbi:MAG: hypothetical protein ACK51N_02540, partial [bacterium]